MINLFKNLFGEKADLGELIRNGAIIVDVRTKDEFQRGHVRNSINIPLDKLAGNLKKLRNDKPIITCCESGARSAAAKNILKSNGFDSVYNGGPWRSLANKR
ncbi:MAG: rhodanese-like domain-containing protein [Bacteroidales bacterium]